MTNDLLTQFQETTVDLLQTVSLFTQEQFNTIPFEESWTAAQVAEHLFKAESGLPKVLQGNTGPTARPVDQNVAMIKQIFLDFTHKMKSPAFIIPSPAEVIQDKEALYTGLKANRMELERLFSIVDLSLTYTDFPLPNLGELTGVEWLVFLTSHSIRHIHQLKNIHKAFG